MVYNYYNQMMKRMTLYLRIICKKVNLTGTKIILAEKIFILDEKNLSWEKIYYLGRQILFHYLHFNLFVQDNILFRPR